MSLKSRHAGFQVLHHPKDFVVVHPLVQPAVRQQLRHTAGGEQVTHLVGEDIAGLEDVRAAGELPASKEHRGCFSHSV